MRASPTANRLIAWTLDNEYRSKGEAIAHTIASASIDPLLLEGDAARLQDMVDRYAGEKLDVEEWDIPALIREAARVFGLDPHVLETLELETKSNDEIIDAVWGLAKSGYEEKDFKGVELGEMVK